MKGVSRIALLCLVAACGGGTPAPKETLTAPGGTKNQAEWPEDDKSMCDWRNKPELEVSETVGPGAVRPNIRRVYKTFGDAETRHKALVCREVDTNLDGIKDIVRRFNAKGEAVKEEADTNYDGKLDVWVSFDQGRLVEEDVDANFDGRVDTWKSYSSGQLSKIKRDRNFDGKPDVWEIYVKGRLERMGVDETNDQHVDRWDRDDQLRLAREAEEDRLKSVLMADGGASSDASAPGDGGVVTDGGKPRGKR
jgi:hypothetical protein